MSKILVLFDVDGTLTEPRQKITEHMDTFIFQELSKFVVIGVVGGSDLTKQKEQLGGDVIQKATFSFSENGLVAYRDGHLLKKTSIIDHLGESNLKRIINWSLVYISKLDIPIKRGTFIEFRSGMLNISPIGRNCSKTERDAFEIYDRSHHVRSKMIDLLKAELADLDLEYSIGGQISFDVFPRGWDKTYCLQFIDPGEFQKIYFFGDKTERGGNDFEIYHDKRVIGYSVRSWQETESYCRELFMN